jgi:hypothetical protein
MVLDTGLVLSNPQRATAALCASAFELVRQGRAQRPLLNWRRLEAEGVGRLCVGREVRRRATGRSL